MDRRPGTRHGLVRPRFIPPRPQRELRELTRYRTTFVRERATLVNRVQKVLESTTRKRASVVSDGDVMGASVVSDGDVMGASSRAILGALLAGEADPAVWAGLAKGQLRKKRPQLEQALQGHLHPHQSCVLTELLAQIESLEETMARFDAQIREACDRQDEAAQVVSGAAGHDSRDGGRDGPLGGGRDRPRQDALPLRCRARGVGGARAGPQRERRSRAASAAAAPARATSGSARPWSRPPTPPHT
jgi:hypothetical protein